MKEELTRKLIKFFDDNRIVLVDGDNSSFMNINIIDEDWLIEKLEVL